MTKFKIALFYLLLALFSAACQSTRAAPISNDIIDSSDIVKKTNLDNAYLSLNTDDNLYYAGFTVDQNSINHPTLVELDKVNGKIRTWNFDDVISDIFIFDNKVSLVLDGGNSFSLQENSWNEIPLVLEEQSRIVFSSANNRLITCSPASPLKSSSDKGGSQSHNPNWQVTFPWREIKPKVCGDQLYAVTWENTENRRIAIDVNTES